MIERLIEEAARRGRLDGLTLWRTADAWQANVTADGTSWRISVRPDPVDALRDVLSEKPTAPPAPAGGGVFE